MTLRGADEIFNRYLTSKHEVLRLLAATPEQLVANLWSEQSPLPIDRGCMFRPGSPAAFTSTPRGVRKFHACMACRTLDRLVDLQKTPPGTPFIIEAGSETGKELMVSSEPAGNLSIKITTGPPLLAQRASPLSRQIDVYLESDRFTHAVLISWVLENILQLHGMPNSEKIYTAFICGDRGYLLSQALQAMTELTLVQSNDVAVVTGVLLQLCTILLTLDEHDFIHGAPSLSSLRFSSEPCSYMFHDKAISAPLTLCLTDLTKASITLRLASEQDEKSHDQDAKLRGRRLRLVPRHELPSRHAEMLSSLPLSTDNLYTLNNKTILAYSHLHSLGIPICKSMEAYCFLLALMLSETRFADVVLSTPSLRKAFESIWEPSQVNAVINDIKSLREEGMSDLSSLQLLNVLRPYTLRKDVLAVLLSGL